jgi:hypothetical protein
MEISRIREIRMNGNRKHRTWHSRMVSLAYLIEHASRTSKIPHEHFVQGFNKIDKDRILKIIEKREFWRGTR